VFAPGPQPLLLCCEHLDIEGVVAKRLDSLRAEERFRDWVKVKTPTWRDRHAPRRNER
jgi:ATP-dependent DNA ligase